MTFAQYFKGLFQSIGALIGGMRITLKELFSKKITQQYPENRKTLVIPDRFRGELVMPHDPNNEHACTACGICETNCPNGTIRVVTKSIETEDGKSKKALDRYFYDLGMCTFCNLCVISCPFKAIKFENTFENAVFTHSKLKMQLNREGSKLKEKKKAPVAEKTEASETVKKVVEKSENTEFKSDTPSQKTEVVKPKSEQKVDIEKEPTAVKPQSAEDVKSERVDTPVENVTDETKPIESKPVINDDNKKDETGKGSSANKYRI